MTVIVVGMGIFALCSGGVGSDVMRLCVEDNQWEFGWCVGWSRYRGFKVGSLSLATL